MDARPRLLILVYSNLEMDARVLRQVRWLSKRYEVTSAAFGRSPVEGVEHIELEDLPPYRPGALFRLAYIARFLLRMFPSVSRNNFRDKAALRRLDGRTWDVIVANDVETLPLAFRLKPRCGVLADVHEYATRQGEHSRSWRWTVAPYMRWLVKNWVSRAAAVTTVSKGLADAYLAEFGIPAQVVTNAALMLDLRPSPVRRPIRLVHSGLAAPQRRLEIMIDAVKMSKADATLDFFLVEDHSPYLRSLRQRAAREPRIQFNPSVRLEALAATLSEFDVGLSVFPPTTFNLAWCLPNKFFDYVQARLGIVIGPSPEMVRVVTDHGLGAITEDFSAKALAQVLDALTPELVAEWKQAADRAAKPLSGESQLNVFERIVGEVLAGSKIWKR
jgi:hypothetical protein